MSGYPTCACLSARFVALNWVMTRPRFVVGVGELRTRLTAAAFSR